MTAEIIKIAPALEDLENCIGLAISAHKVERFDHVIHYLEVCRKHIRSVNIDIEEWTGETDQESVLSGQIFAEGCGKTKAKPSLDDYDSDMEFIER